VYYLVFPYLYVSFAIAFIELAKHASLNINYPLHTNQDTRSKNNIYEIIQNTHQDFVTRSYVILRISLDISSRESEACVPVDCFLLSWALEK